MESLYTMSDKIIDEILLQINRKIFNKLAIDPIASISKELYTAITYNLNSVGLRMLDKDTILEAALDDS